MCSHALHCMYMISHYVASVVLFFLVQVAMERGTKLNQASMQADRQACMYMPAHWGLMKLAKGNKKSRTMSIVMLECFFVYTYYSCYK